MFLAVKNNLIKAKTNSVIAQFEGHIYEPKVSYKLSTVTLLLQYLYQNIFKKSIVQI